MFGGIDVSIYGLPPQERSRLSDAIKSHGGLVHYVPSPKVPFPPPPIYFQSNARHPEGHLTAKVRTFCSSANRLFIFLYFCLFLCIFFPHPLQTTHLVVTEDFIKANPVRTEEAQKKGHRLVSAQFFSESIDKGQRLDDLPFLFAVGKVPSHWVQLISQTFSSLIYLYLCKTEKTDILSAQRGTLARD